MLEHPYLIRIVGEDEWTDWPGKDHYDACECFAMEYDEDGYLSNDDNVLALEVRHRDEETVKLVEVYASVKIHYSVIDLNREMI